MKYLFMTFLLILVIIIAGCSNGVTGDVVADASLCDDNNFCTADVLINDKCSYSPITPCCGNGICETGEGCNVATKTTGCNQDCNICEADVEIGLNNCEGECLVAADGSLRVKGDSKISFNVKNLGEEKVMLDSKFECSKQGLGTGSVKLDYYGFSSEGYFSNSQNKITLEGKGESEYNVILTGKPNQYVGLECNAYMTAGPKIFLEYFFLKLE